MTNFHNYWRIFIYSLSIALIVFITPASADNFDKWVKNFWPVAKKAGISRSTYKAAFRNVRPDPKVLEKANRQAEFVKPLWSYMGSAVSESRIENGREMLKKHKRRIAAIEAKYGVDRHIFVAIWGMESAYGAILDNPNIVMPTIRSLATLAYAGGRRKKFGRQQLLSALKILQNGDTTPAKMVGSWAGAMGHTQFIPTTYRAYAVDFTGDGKRDIWGSISDALASTAHYLKRSGWSSDKTWGYEVRLPRRFNYALADSRKKRSLSEWQQLGLRRANGKNFPRPSDKAHLYIPMGTGGPAFLLLHNFRVIKRYNNADAYALAVGHLADRLAGYDAFKKDWDRDNAPLNRKQRKELQALLNRKGYNTGGIDGKIGRKTHTAIRRYQKSIGLTPDGYASKKLLTRLQSS